MKRVVYAILYSAILAGCCPNQDVKIACVGDSITEGMGIKWQSNNSYPSMLDSILGNGYEVMNFGRSSTTMMKEGNFPYWSAKEFSNTLRYHPDIIILKLGTNDAKLFQWDVEKYKDSYQAMIDTFKTLTPQPRILLCTPAPVIKDRWEITDSVVTNYIIPAINEIAEDNCLEIIDINFVLKNKGDMFVEGIHPNKQGAKLMAEEIAKHIK